MHVSLLLFDSAIMNVSFPDAVDVERPIFRSCMHKPYPMESSKEQNNNNFTEFLGYQYSEKKTIFKKFLVRSCHYLVTHDEKNQKQCLEKIKEKQRKNIKSKMI